LPEGAEQLAAHDTHVIPIPIDTDRAISPDEIAERLRTEGVTVHDPQPLADALDAFRRTAAPEDGLLLVGSHKLVERLPNDFLDLKKSSG